LGKSSECIKGLDLELLEENTGTNIHGLIFGNDVKDLTSKAQATTKTR
jgi:hypothetical protein